MTERPEPVPDADTARRATKDSVRDAIGKLIGDDNPSRPATDAADRKRPPER